MKKGVPLTSLLDIAKRISPRTTIPLIIAIDDGIDRFGSLNELYPMSTRTMAKALKKMEQEAMIKKRPNGSYELTDKGAAFTIHARQMVAWIEKNYDLKIINH